MLDCWVFCHRFCPTKWNEGQPVAERAVRIWKKVIAYWKCLCKSSRPGVKSYETLVSTLLMPMKLQFLTFLAKILKPYLTVFQTNKPMVPFK